jgi:hypothetical protein
MSPSRCVPLACLALLSGCGGTWSLDDLTFSAALPWREDLLLALPPGVGTSPSWTATRRAVGEANPTIERLTVFADQVRRAEPTERTSGSRRWGPFSASDVPGVSLSVAVESRGAGTFTWALDVERAAERGQLVGGETTAGATLRLGEGSLRAPLARVRPLITLPAPLASLDEAEVHWAISEAARLVRFTAVPSAGAAWATPTLVAELRDETRSFTLRRDAGVGTLEFTATIDPLGAGRAEGWLIDGPSAGATFSECWNAAFETTWLAERWPDGGRIGDEAACPR